MSRHRRQSLKRRARTAPMPERRIRCVEVLDLDGYICQDLPPLPTEWTCFCRKKHPLNRHRCKKCRMGIPVKLRPRGVACLTLDLGTGKNQVAWSCLCVGNDPSPFGGVQHAADVRQCDKCGAVSPFQRKTA